MQSNTKTLENENGQPTRNWLRLTPYRATIAKPRGFAAMNFRFVKSLMVPARRKLSSLLPTSPRCWTMPGNRPKPSRCSSWRTLRRSSPLAAAPPKPPTTPPKRMQLAKNTPLTKLLRSDFALPSQSRDRLRVFIDRPGVPPLFCFPMNFTAHTHRHHHDHGHSPRALGCR